MYYDTGPGPDQSAPDDDYWDQRTACAHQQETGHPINPGQLADRLTIPLALAEALLDHLDGTTPPPVTATNGTPVTREDRP